MNLDRKLHRIFFEGHCDACGGWDVEQGGSGHKRMCPKGEHGTPISVPEEPGELGEPEPEGAVDLPTDLLKRLGRAKQAQKRHKPPYGSIVDVTCINPNCSKQHRRHAADVGWTGGYCDDCLKERAKQRKQQQRKALAKALKDLEAGTYDDPDLDSDLNQYVDVGDDDPAPGGWASP